jgi:2-polyprenyl-3-methyl-5-hydroxy-6-metoxy-1,4-benzoquinol methylase
MGAADQLWQFIRHIRFRPSFSGTWDDRLSGLFACEVDFKGRRVLDAGSNMGVIAYEISKLRPSFIHGIDRFRRAVTVARRIFAAINVPHRFDVVDFFDDRKVLDVLEPSYDIVLLMAVWQHIVRADEERAARFLDRVAVRCREAVVFRGSEDWGEHFERAIAKHGFTLAFRGERASDAAGPILVFRRSVPPQHA